MKIDPGILSKICSELCNNIINVEINSSSSLSRDVWMKLADSGFLGITIDQKYGGLGLGYSQHCIAMQCLSAINPSLGLSYAAHSNLCINQIYLNGSPEQKTKYLPALTSSKKIGALAISEDNHGSNAMGVELRAKEFDNYYVLNGHKMWITNGPDADVIVTYAKTNALNNKSLTAFIVNANSPGVTKSDAIEKIGMKLSKTCRIKFENVKVSKEDILGGKNNGATVMMSGLDYERLILASGPLGIMEKALKEVLKYCRKRKQFGKKIGEFQLVQARLAEMYTKYQASCAFLYETANKFDKGIISRKDAASVILFTSTNAVNVALEAIQCFGGNGYCQNYAVSNLLTDAKLYEIGAGTSDIRKILIGRELYYDN